MKLKGVIPGLILSLMLSGCGANLADQPSPDPLDTSTPTKVYEAMIEQLQQQLADLRSAQLQQNAKYEERITELEQLLSKAESSEPTISPPTSPDATVSAESDFVCVEESNGIYITSYLGNDSLVEIPQTIHGKQVIGIGEGAFRNCAAEQVILPEGLQRIGWFAFSGCYRLSSVILPTSVECIEYGAFELCSTSLRFSCPAGSYAARYAESYGIPVIATKQSS